MKINLHCTRSDTYSKCAPRKYNKILVITHKFMYNLQKIPPTRICHFLSDVVIPGELHFGILFFWFLLCFSKPVNQPKITTKNS